MRPTLSFDEADGYQRFPVDYAGDGQSIVALVVLQGCARGRTEHAINLIEIISEFL
jgi:hypothetical protein